MNNPTLPRCGKDDVFIWNMLSLNGMRPFGVNSILKPCWLDSK